MKVKPIFIFNNIGFRARVDEPNKPSVNNVQTPSNAPITSPIKSEMYSGSLVNLQASELEFKTALEGLKSPNGKARTNAWRTIASKINYNTNLALESEEIFSTMPKSLASQNIFEKTFATRVFRHVGHKFPKNEELSNQLVANLRVDNDLLKDATLIALRNRFNESKLTDEHIDKIIPHLTEAMSKEEKPGNSYLFIRDLCNKEKINSKNIGDIPNVLATKLHSYMSNNVANECFEIITKLDEANLLKEPYMKYLSEGMKFDDVNKNKRALYYISQKLDKIDKDGVGYITPNLVRTMSSSDPVVKGQTVGLIKVIYDNNLLNHPEKDKLKPMLISGMASENPIIAGKSSSVVLRMIANNDTANLDFERNIVGIVKNLYSPSEITRRTVGTTLSAMSEVVPFDTKKYILKNGIKMTNAETPEDKYLGYKIVKNYLGKDNIYKIYNSKIDDVILNNFETKDEVEYKHLRKLFDEIFDVYGGTCDETRALSNKFFNYVEKNKVYNISSLPLLKTLVKFSTLDKNQTKILSERLTPLVNSTDTRVQAETVSTLGKLVNKHLLSKEDETRVLNVLNGADSLSGSVRGLMERELISRDALTDNNKQRVLANLYDNLYNPDVKVRTSTLRSLPDLYTRNILPYVVDEKILTAVVDAVYSDDQITKNSGIKAFGDMAQYKVVRQEDVDKCLPIIKEQIKSPRDKISGGIAVKAFGQFSFNKNITADDVNMMEPHLLKYLQGSDIVNKTIALEAISNTARIHGTRLSKDSIKTLNRTVAELYADKNISTRGSVLKSMTNLEHSRVLYRSLAQELLPEIIENDLTSVETRHRSKAVNLLRILKYHDLLSEEQMKRIDKVLEQSLNTDNKVLSALIEAYKTTSIEPLRI